MQAREATTTEQLHFGTRNAHWVTTSNIEAMLRKARKSPRTWFKAVKSVGDTLLPPLKHHHPKVKKYIPGYIVTEPNTDMTRTSQCAAGLHIYPLGVEPVWGDVKMIVMFQGKDWIYGLGGKMRVKQLYVSKITSKQELKDGLKQVQRSERGNGLF